MRRVSVVYGDYVGLANQSFSLCNEKRVTSYAKQPGLEV